MKIQIENKLYIESDDRQFIIKKYTGTFDKTDPEKELFKPLGYYGTLRQAVKAIIKMKLMKSDATTIKELLNELTRIEDEINQLITV